MDFTCEYKLPLGLCKQACMKLESFISDIHEIKEDADLTPEDRYTFSKLAEMAGVMEAAIINIVRKECSEEEFLNENIPMDEIDLFPEKETENILDELIER